MRWFVLFLMVLSTLFAQKFIECRIITKGVKECNPYSTKYIYSDHLDSDEKHFIASHQPLTPATKTLLYPKLIDDKEKVVIKDKKPYRFKTKEELYAYIKELEIYAVQKVDVAKKPHKLKSKEELDKYIKELESYTKETLEAEDQIGTYTVVAGDALSRIARKFGMKTNVLRVMNNLRKGSILQIGQKLKVTSSQEIIDAITTGKYKVKADDTLASIAKKFKFTTKELAKYNKLKVSSCLVTGKVLKLPIPAHIRDANYGTRTLRVTATAYTSHAAQTDSTPFLAAWNNRLVPGMKSIAVSRDLLSVYGMRNGTKVRIAGLPGIYRVRDKMNKRYKKRIDIYMGLDRPKALRWGKRSVKIYWD